MLKGDCTSATGCNKRYRDELKGDGKALKGDAKGLNGRALSGDGVCLGSSKLLLYVTFRH